MAHAPPIVDVAWLAEHLDEPSLRILDASWYLPADRRDARAEYEAGHIPGARFADLEALSDQSSALPHTLPAPMDLAARFAELGVGIAHRVVIYDGVGLFTAPRVWWMLRTLGHPYVSVLDGGFPAWKRAGLPVSRAVPRPSPATWIARFNGSAWVDLEGVRRLDGKQIVDARSPGRFAGAEAEPRAGVRPGHIPGARNVHYASLTDAQGLLLPPAELEARFREAGVDVSQPLVLTCGSGVTACTLALALATIGAPEPAVYDGSWTEWGGRDDTPVATGPAD